MEFQSLTEVLNFAISKEQQAFDLYSMFESMVKNAAAKKLLNDLAAQEAGHRRMLESALSSKNVDRIKGKGSISDLHLSDYMVVETITSDSDPQQVMVFAMKREQEAYDNYNLLLSNYGGTELQGLFSRLAEEELRHKTTLEEQYEKHFAQWM